MNLIERIIDDPLFYRWVFNPDDYTNQLWDSFIVENPEFAEEIMDLKNRLLQIQIADVRLKDREKRRIAKNILLNTIDKKSIRKQNTFTLLFKYAAIAIIFFSMGGSLVYFYFQNKNLGINISEVHNLSQISRPTLILPEGKNVDLYEKDSKLDYSQGGKIIVNDKQVIESKRKSRESKINQLIIPYGNRSKITLSDNSVVHLNAGSRLFYPSEFNDSKREVLLFGEAFFEVAEDKEHPFVVKTTDLSIQVLGTKFNVSAYPEDNVIQAVLTEGKISLRRNDASMFEDDIIVMPDQMAWFNKTSQKTNIRKVDVSYYTLWKDELVKFSNEDLSRVIKQLERFYNISFSFENPLDGSIKITGKLNLKEEKEEVFEYISRVALVKIEKDKGNRYIIK